MPVLPRMANWQMCGYPRSGVTSRQDRGCVLESAHREQAVAGVDIVPDGTGVRTVQDRQRRLKNWQTRCGGGVACVRVAPGSVRRKPLQAAVRVSSNQLMASAKGRMEDKMLAYVRGKHKRAVGL